MTTTKEDLFESTFYEGWGARRDNIPRWCTTHKGRLKQLWLKGWDEKDREINNERNH